MDNRWGFPELPKPEQKLVIGSTGSIGSGKSTFLSALHAVLGYHNRGIKLDKDSIRGLSCITEPHITSVSYDRLRKGLFRANATERPDSMFVYGVNGKNIYQFNFVAPGGHIISEKLNGDSDGLLYFIDLSLADFVKDLDKRCTINIGNHKLTFADNGSLTKQIEQNLLEGFRMGHFDGEEFWLPESRETECVEAMKGGLDITDDGIRTLEDLAKSIEKTAKRLPNFGLPVEKKMEYVNKEGIHYKGECLGAVVQSIIESHEFAIAEGARGVPVIGVCTHKDMVYGKLPREPNELMKAVQENFNKAIELYAQYKKSEGINSPAPPLDLQNGNLSRLFLIDLISTRPHYRGDDPEKKGRYSDWKDNLLNMNNMTVLEAAYCMMASALQQKSVDSGQLKILTFSNKKSDMTVHYELIR